MSTQQPPAQPAGPRKGQSPVGEMSEAVTRQLSRLVLTLVIYMQQIGFYSSKHVGVAALLLAPIKTVFTSLQVYRLISNSLA